MSKSKTGRQDVHGARRAAPRSRGRTRAFPRSAQGGVTDVHAFCRTTPELYLVLTPELTIVDASDAYRRATLLWGEAITGCGIFDVFPNNPHDATADGAQNLRASFQQVLQRGRPHRMALQWYDVRDHVAGDGAWIEKLWMPVNAPVFGGDSREITRILHHVTDVTQAVLLRQQLAAQAVLLAEQRATLDRMRQEVLRGQRALRTAQKPLTAMLRARQPQAHALDALQWQLGVPDTRLYWEPGRRAPVAGIYAVFHQRACALVPRMVFLAAGKAFPRCPRCQEGVLYRLMKPLLA